MNSFLTAILFCLVRFLPKKKVERTNNFKQGIVSLLCEDDLLLFIFSIKSFFFFLKKDLPVFVINDGSLSDRSINFLHRLFDITIVSQPANDRKMRKILQPYKSLYHYRFNSEATIHKLKIDACLLNPFEQFIFLDSDILFFRPPDKILHWLNRSNNEVLTTTFTKGFIGMCEKSSADFLLKKILLEHVHIKNKTQDFFFISSLLCIPNKQKISLENMEKIALILRKYDSFIYEHADEFLLMSLFSEKCIKLDPERYCNLNLYMPVKIVKPIMIHYVSEQVKMQIAIIKLLFKTLFFRKMTY